MAKKRLNAKQEAFCKQIVLGKSATEAYQAAFKAPSQPTCAVNGCKLLRKPLIASRIKELQEQNAKLTEAASQKAIENAVNYDIASIAERKDILTKIARGQIPLVKPMVVDGRIQEVPVVPDWMDRKNAIAELNKMDGSYAPTKTELSVNEQITEIRRTVISKNAKDS